MKFPILSAFYADCRLLCPMGICLRRKPAYIGVATAFLSGDDIGTLFQDYPLQPFLPFFGGHRCWRGVLVA